MDPSPFPLRGTVYGGTGSYREVVNGLPAWIYAAVYLLKHAFHLAVPQEQRAACLWFMARQPNVARQLQNWCTPVSKPPAPSACLPVPLRQTGQPQRAVQPKKSVIPALLPHSSMHLGA